MRAEGFADKAVRIEQALDMRYSGQSFELTVPFAGDIIAAFHRAHQKRYGYSDRARLCEIVNVRARFTGRTPKPGLPKLKAGGSDPKEAVVSRINMMFAGRQLDAVVYDRSKLSAGNRLSGPAIVTEYSATTFVPPRWIGRVDLYGNILLEPAR
jgi:N-methylhydantoinase A